MARVIDPMPSPHAIGAAQLVAWGVTFYAIPPLLPPITRGMAVSPASASVAMTAGLVLSAFGSVAVGAWIQRRGARGPMVFGTTIATLALVGMAISPWPEGILVGLAVLGSTSALLLYEPALAAIGIHTREPEVRVRAIQIVTFWGGWAGLAAIPVTLMSARWGWRAALVVLAAVLLVKTLPVHRRLPLARASAGPARGCASPSCATRLPRRLALGFALAACATAAVVVHGVLLLEGRGLDTPTAAFAFALMAPVQIAGRTWLLSRRGRLAPHDRIMPFVLVAAGLVALSAAPNGPALVFFVALFGSGTGLLTTIRSTLVATLVPAEQLAVQLGEMNLVVSLARAAAPVVGAATHGLLGFHGAVLVPLALAVGGAGLVASVRPGPSARPRAMRPARRERSGRRARHLARSTPSRP
jgi:MFS family permease